MDKKRFIVIDGNAVIHRAFHALPPLTTKNGEVVNAIYGFLLVFLRAMKEFKPEFVVVALDFPAPSFRQKIYEPYKATRKKAPDELYQQIPKTKELLENFGVQVFEKEGYEADDIIGTIAKAAGKRDDIETIIVSGDLDTLQTIDKNTKVYALRKGVKDIVLYDEKAVQEKYEGLGPKQLNDFKALRGDPSDNIPGVFGVGEKTAIALLKNFKTLENLYRELEEKTEKAQNIKESLRKKLLEYKDKAFLSKELAQLKYDVPFGFNLEKCRWSGFDKEKAAKALGNYEFYSLIPRVTEQETEKKISEKEKKKTKNKQENLSIWGDLKKV